MISLNTHQTVCRYNQQTTSRRRRIFLKQNPLKFARKALAVASLSVYFMMLSGTAVKAQDLIGAEKNYITDSTEILADIAQKTGVGYVELRVVNPRLDPWNIRKGETLLIPDRHILPLGLKEGFTVNIGDMRLYYSDASGDDIRSWPVGIGREGRRTPTGALKVSELRKNPTWRPTKKMRELDPSLPTMVPPGPANPLGKYAVRIGWNGYIIHGTNKPAGIGRRVSSGCVRLYDTDIKEIFGLAKIGMNVTLIDEPVKVGWDGHALYLEAHPTGEQADQIEAVGIFDAVPPGDLTKVQLAIVEKAKAHNLSRIDWAAFDRTIRERRGVPEIIAK